MSHISLKSLPTSDRAVRCLLLYLHYVDDVVKKIYKSGLGCYLSFGTSDERIFVC